MPGANDYIHTPRSLVFLTNLSFGHVAEGTYGSRPGHAIYGMARNIVRGKHVFVIGSKVKWHQQISRLIQQR